MEQQKGQIIRGGKDPYISRSYAFTQTYFLNVEATDGNANSKILLFLTVDDNFVNLL